jgi:exonuclease III
MTKLSLMSINLEYGGELTIKGIKYKKNSNYYNKFINQYIKFISKYNPDVIAFQEIAFRNTNNTNNTRNTHTTAYFISNKLNYYYYESKKKNELAIASKYPIQKIIDKKLYCGIEIKINNKLFRIFNLHLNDEPCTYYSLQNIPYNNTPNNLTPIEASKLSSDDKLPVLKNIMKYSNKNTIIMGDFNEPSHLDWNKKAVKHNIIPCIVKWQSSSYLYYNNFIDIVRQKYKCNVRYPMNTCDVIRNENIINPPTRIDFIYTNTKLKEIQKVYNIPIKISDHLPVFVKIVL